MSSNNQSVDLTMQFSPACPHCRADGKKQRRIKSRYGDWKCVSCEEFHDGNREA